MDGSGTKAEGVTQLAADHLLHDELPSEVELWMLWTANLTLVVGR